MLQDLIKDLQTSLKNYSQGLAKQNLLVDIPWTIVDGDLNIQRLIFRKDNSLYIVTRPGKSISSKTVPLRFPGNKPVTRKMKPMSPVYTSRLANSRCRTNG